MKILLTTLSLLLSLAVCGQKFELIKDVYPGNNGDPSFLTELQGSLYFVGTIDYQSGNDFALFKTDGSVGNATIIKTFSSSVQDVEVFDNKLYISLYNGELWSSDGTTQGTQLVEANCSNYLTVFNNQLYYVGITSTVSQVFVTDGIPGHATPVSSFSCGVGLSFGPSLVATQTHIFCPGQSSAAQCASELYATDGTTPFVQLTSISTVTGIQPERLTACGNKIFFNGNDSIAGQEVWVSDGTIQGTHLVKDIAPGIYGSQHYPSHFFPWGNDVYFAGQHAYGSFWGLWKTDGSGSGTIKLADSFATPPLLQKDHAISFNNDLYFYGSQHLSQTSYRHGIFQTDGSITGTTFYDTLTEDSGPFHFINYNGRIYINPLNLSFSNNAFYTFGNSSNGLEIINPSASPQTKFQIWYPKVFKNSLFFAGDIAQPFIGSELYKFTGEPNNVEKLNNSKHTAHIYPLPVHDHATLELYVQGNIGNAEIAMYDMTGRLVSAPVRTQLSPGINKLDINTASLANGMYHVVVRGDDYNEVIKIVK